MSAKKPMHAMIIEVRFSSAGLFHSVSENNRMTFLLPKTLKCSVLNKKNATIKERP